MKCDKTYLIKLLTEKNKTGYTYEYLSSLTGYHKKYLIYLNKKIKNNKSSEILSRKNKIPMDEEKYILKLYRSWGNTNITKFYEYYKSSLNGYKLRAYSTIYKLIVKSDSINTGAVNESITVPVILASNFKIGNLNLNICSYLYIKQNGAMFIYLHAVNRKFIHNLTNLLRYVINVNKLSTDIYMNLSVSLGNKINGMSQFERMCMELGVNSLECSNEIKNDIHKIKKNIKNAILECNCKNITDINNILHNMLEPNITSENNLKYDIDRILCFKYNRTTIFENIVQFENNRYKIINDTPIKRREDVIIMKSFKNKITVLYKGTQYETCKVVSVYSKRKYDL
ncbi:MAG: hypothetical protein A2Y24_04005 [Clostridiales bacterium GWE2_32_10]|nr:MAG: hypothetical protein A2Y24_04005 [Clostridiales bacterium GWE2_32_10]